jgi:hypothetical protein
MSSRININKSFLEAGRAIFTVSNDKGEHYTYRIGQSRNPSRPMYFASMLGKDGIDTGTSRLWTYLGTYDKTTGAIRLTQGSKVNEESRGLKVLRWAVQRVHLSKDIPEGYKIQHAGRCGRCSRRLTDPESLRIGLGPECSGKIIP